jgi:hypothetical protein
MPGAGATARLARALGTAKALEWVLRGRLFSPEEAAREGLVHHFIPSDVLVAAREMAKEFLDKPPRALASIKQLIRASADQPLAESLDRESCAFVSLLSHDAQAVKMMKDYVAGGHQLKKEINIAKDTHVTAPTRFVEANGIHYAYRDPLVTDGLAQGRPVTLPFAPRDGALQLPRAFTRSA